MSISVIDFGAKGDKTTDNSPTLQALIDSLPDNNEVKVIHFPSGYYGLEATLKLNKSNVIFEGPGVLYSLGRGSSRRCLLQVNTYPSSDVTNNRYQNITIRGLGFDMSVPYAQSPIPWDSNWENDGMMFGALAIKGIDNLSIENVRFYMSVHGALTINGCYNVQVNYVTVDMMKSHMIPGGFVWGGNAVNLVAYGATNATSVGSITNGRIGYYRMSNCHIYGSETWLPPIGAEDVTEQCSIGIMVRTGSPNIMEHQIDPIMITGCTVERCYWGILAEGENQGGSGNVVITNNAIKECISGVGLYPDHIGDLGHNSYNFILSNNKITDIYTYAILCMGENILITNNMMRDWGLLKTSDPISSRQNKSAFAMIIQPKNKQNTTQGVFHNVKISDNICEISTPHDGTLASGVSGIYIDNQANANTIFRDVMINNNVLNGGKSTYGPLQGNSGIWIVGKVQNITIHHNIITGFPRQAIVAGLANYQDGITGVSKMFITDNIMYDLCWRNGGTPDSAITIYSGNTDFEIANNKVYQIEGTNLMMVLIIPQINNIDSPLNELILRNNFAKNLKYGDTVIFSLNITGEAVKIENNSGWNYGTVMPSGGGQNRFRGEFIQNTSPEELGATGAKYIVEGWRCIQKGKPGVWVSQQVRTGN